MSNPTNILTLMERLRTCGDPTVQRIGFGLIGVTIEMLESCTDKVVLTGQADPMVDAPLELRLRHQELLAELREYSRTLGR